MTEFITEHEPTVRLACFAGIFLAVAVAEVVAPRRVLSTPKGYRWFTNISVVIINAGIIRLVFPVAALGMAIEASRNGWGLFNNVDVPAWAAFCLSIIFLDFVVYLQHVMFHTIPRLWRLHMMHHADLDFDLTTGSRFHPLEIMISMVIKIMAVALLGPPLLSVVLFEVILNGTAMFNHGNLRIPLGIDRILRLFVVTPDMHRVHHSVFPHETNSNFGFNLPWWDYLMGTYRSQPRLGHEKMIIGLNQFRDPSHLTLIRILALPFTGRVGPYPINRRGISGEGS